MTIAELKIFSLYKIIKIYHLNSYSSVQSLHAVQTIFWPPSLPKGSDQNKDLCTHKHCQIKSISKGKSSFSSVAEILKP